MRRSRIFALAVLLLLAAMPAWAEDPHKFLIFFEEWSAQLDPIALDVVTAAAAHAKADAARRITVTGYADKEGNLATNMTLSMLRAMRVADLLVEAGVGGAQVVPIGAGSVTHVDTALEGRRVEIRIDGPR